MVAQPVARGLERRHEDRDDVPGGGQAEDAGRHHPLVVVRALLQDLREEGQVRVDFRLDLLLEPPDALRIVPVGGLVVGVDLLPEVDEQGVPLHRLAVAGIGRDATGDGEQEDRPRGNGPAGTGSDQDRHPGNPPENGRAL